VPLILVPAIGFAILLTCLVLAGMQQGGPYWLKSWLDSMMHPHANWLTRQALRPLAAIAHAALWIYHQVMHALSVAASHSMHQVAHWFDGLANTIVHASTVTGDFAADVAHGFERVVHQTIPHAIHRALVPVWRGIDHLERDFHHLAQRLTHFARGIDRLIAHRILPAIRAAEHAIAVTIPRELGRIRARERAAERAIRHPSRAWIKRIWRAGWVLVGAGLMVRFLTRKFPYLFCRNSTNALKAVCGMDTSLLTALLAGTVALNEVNLREFCRTLQAIEGEIVSEIHGFVTLDD
jgi:hypothetical protein